MSRSFAVDSIAGLCSILLMNIEDYKIHLLDTNFGQLQLSNEFGEWFGEIQELALSGDRRFKKTKDAIKQFDSLIKAVDELHLAAFQAGVDIKEIFA